MTELEQTLEGLIGGQVAVDDTTLEDYSTDWSLFKVRPQAVVYPLNADDLHQLIVWANQQLKQDRVVSLTARGMGTGLTGGSLNDGLIVDLSRHFTTIEVLSDDQTIWSQTGILFKQIKQIADEHGLMFGAYHNSYDRCSLGGMLGNNASGEKSLRYGSTSDNVSEIKVCLSDGQEYHFGPLSIDQLAAKCQQTNFEGYLYQTVRGLLEANADLLARRRPQVRKNASGYDLWRIWDRNQQRFNLAHLFIGAQGTLGIITEAKLQLMAHSLASQLLVIKIDNLTQLATTVQNLLNHNPESLEIYDNQIFQLATVNLAPIANRVNYVDRWPLVLLARFAEINPTRTEAIAQMAAAELTRQKLTVRSPTDPAEVAAHWQIRRASLELLVGKNSLDWRACLFLDDLIVSPTHFGQFMVALEAILSDYQLNYSYHGHVGDGSLRVIPLIDLNNDQAMVAIKDLAERVYGLVAAFDGSISGDHNDGLLRSNFLKTVYGSKVVGLFDQIKQAFDPLGIFNPKKKTDANLSYSLARIDRTNQSSKS